MSQAFGSLWQNIWHQELKREWLTLALGFRWLSLLWQKGPDRHSSSHPGGQKRPSANGVVPLIFRVGLIPSVTLSGKMVTDTRYIPYQNPGCFWIQWNRQSWEQLKWRYEIWVTGFTTYLRLDNDLYQPQFLWHQLMVMDHYWLHSWEDQMELRYPGTAILSELFVRLLLCS